MAKGKEQALQILNEWFAERKLIRCRLDFKKFVAAMTVRAFSKPDRELRLVSDDSTSEFVLTFTSSMVFLYGDCTEIDGYQNEYNRYVMILLDEIPASGLTEQVILMDHKDIPLM
jgi:hypothetical protein